MTHPSSVPNDAAFKALHLLPSAPPEVVKAAYRALAQKHHPDHRGDVKEMQQINAAYELLSKRGILGVSQLRREPPAGELHGNYVQAFEVVVVRSEYAALPL